MAVPATRTPSAQTKASGLCTAPTCIASTSWYATFRARLHFVFHATHFPPEPLLVVVAADQSQRSSLRVIFFTVLLDLLGFGIVIPILPTYAEKMHASNHQIGWLMAIYSVMQLFFSPIWGRLSDRAGRRPILLISILGSCFSQL